MKEKPTIPPIICNSADVDLMIDSSINLTLKYVENQNQAIIVRANIQFPLVKNLHETLTKVLDNIERSRQAKN